MKLPPSAVSFSTAARRRLFFLSMSRMEFRFLPFDNTFSGISPGMVPIGFRLKDDSIDKASLLDQLTFYDLNDPLPEETYEI